MSKVSVVAQTGAGSSDSITILPGNPFNIGFGVVLSGTVSDYTVEHTFDGTNWFPHEAVVNLAADADGNYAYPVAGVRVTITTGTGTATLTAIQAG